jgi:5-formyltetrahydrofolate cyclo-ligase
MEKKENVRKRILSLRKQLSEEERAAKSNIICSKLLHAGWYAASPEILVYSAILKEVDLRAFIQTAWQDGKILYFPKVFGEKMEFFRADAMEELQKGSFGVLEPKDESCPYRAAEQNIVLVPGAAFSEQGARIGYGKGYYDRYFGCWKEEKIPYTAIGIAYDFQVVEEFKTDSNDMDMHWIITEMREVDCEDGLGIVM